jgi:regulatory protein
MLQRQDAQMTKPDKAKPDGVKPDNRELVSASLRLLAGRDMSRAEFIKKLTAKEFLASEMEAAADWCVAEGWLNESRYAESAGRRLGQKYGASRIAQTLRQKGVSEEALSNAMPALKESDFERARVLWLRKYGDVASTAEEKSKQIRYLQTRGFRFDVIKQVIAGETEQS